MTTSTPDPLPQAYLPPLKVRDPRATQRRRCLLCRSFVAGPTLAAPMHLATCGDPLSPLRHRLLLDLDCCGRFAAKGEG